METILERQPATYDYGVPKYAGQPMTKADFLRWESDDNYVYELDNGILEPKNWRKSSDTCSRNTGIEVAPGFVIEFVSENNCEFTSIKKRHEYFDAGVQVVWWVFPLYKEVYVYTSPKTVTICTDDDMLSAAPALPEFQLTVNELFKR